MTLKQKIMYRAIRIRLENGEPIDEIMASYPKLSEIDKEIILSEIAKETMTTDEPIEVS